MGVAMYDMMMLSVEWSAKLCESFPCHVKMDGCV
jgi:Zn-finger protein